MATANKTARVIQAAASNASGGSTISSTIDVRTALGYKITARITNPGTGTVSTGCDFVVDTSNDGSDWYEECRQRAGTVAGATFEFPFRLDPETMYARVRFLNYVHGAGTACTVEADGQELTSIG